MVTDVRSGYINVQSATGVMLNRLEQTNAFGRYNFGWGSEPWWIPEQDFQKIMEHNFPGCDLWSRQAVINRIPSYSSWNSFWHAVTVTGSLFHIYIDGSLMVTMTTSLNAGADRLQTEMVERVRAGNDRGFLLRWTK
jgi:hypothetical protein